MSDNKTPLHSSHIFMFPFRFDWNEKGFDKEYDFYKNENVSERISLKKLHEKLTNSKNNSWKYKDFSVENNYNEYAYFYDYARDAIYNMGNFSPDAISNYYDKDELIGKLFELTIKGETYNLTIAGVTLRVFSTGVALLSLELENYEREKFDDILRINDFGRRVYPQFISDGKVKATKDAFLAENIKIPFLNIAEDFERGEGKVYDDTYIGSHIMELLGLDVFTQDAKEPEYYYIQPSIDDRMFVLSWYGNDTESKSLTKRKYVTNDMWYQYVFIDNNGKTVHSSRMQKELIKNATYDRWMDYEYGLTLFGISRYSFVCLSNDSDFSRDVLPLPHMTTMYFQMVTLLLAIRTSILRFSDEIASLASNENINTEKLTKLYQRYLTFYNRLYFKEVTHQEQGIELYDMARKQMKIDEHMEKLDGKFTKLFEFAKMQSDDKSAEKMDKLTVMGAIFLPPSLMIALFSMGIFDYEQSEHSLYVAVIAMVFSILATIGFINLEEKAKKIKEMLVPAIVITIITLLIVLVPIKFIGEKKEKPNNVKITNEILKVEVKK